MTSHLPDLFRHQKDLPQIINFSLGQFLEAGMKSWTIIIISSYVQRTILGVNAPQMKKRKIITSNIKKIPKATTN